MKQTLIKALALSEASFEFLDEEMEFAPHISSMITDIKSTIHEIKKTFNQQQQIRQGIRVAIIGSVNAGKSSLFNALLNQDRAIVNAQLPAPPAMPLKQDCIKMATIGHLVDTAGLRQTQDIMEQEGIRRSFEEAHKADIIILAYDSSSSLTNEEAEVYKQIAQKYPNKIINVLTKVDTNTSFDTKSSISTQDVYGQQIIQQKIQRELGKKTSAHILSSSQGLRIEALADYANKIAEHFIPLSSKTKNNIETLEQKIEQKIVTLFADIESPFLLNQRQFNLLLALETKLNTISDMLAQKHVAYELLSIHLNDAIAHLAELSGKAISEAGMDMVFREFCVGK